MKCSFSNCTNDATHSYQFPGESRQYLCTPHASASGGTVIRTTDASATLATSVEPIEVPASPAPEVPLCSHKPHNSAHQRPAVLAYSYPGEPVERGPGLEPGVACPACVIEIVRVARKLGWDLELAEL